jgi:hypothetical protein
VIGIATAAAVFAAAVFIPPAVRASREQFIPWMSGWVAALAALAIVLEGVSILWVPVCG